MCLIYGPVGVMLMGLLYLFIYRCSILLKLLKGGILLRFLDNERFFIVFLVGHSVVEEEKRIRGRHYQEPDELLPEPCRSTLGESEENGESRRLA